MKSVGRISASVIVLGLLFHLDAANAACTRYVGPGTFKNPSREWNGSDSGPVVRGHVDLWGEKGKTSGKVAKLLHGIDVSKFDFEDVGNKKVSFIDFHRLRECGTTFGVSRLAFGGEDKFFLENARSFQKVGILNIPYYFFGIPRELRDIRTYQNNSEELQQQFLKKFSELGQAAAQDFFEQLHELGDEGLPTVSLGSLSGRFVAIDIEQKLCSTPAGKKCNETLPKNSESEKRRYGRYYGKATCTWVQAVQKKYPDVIVLLYTTPSVWAEYLDQSFPEEDACLSSLPVWVARTNADAGPYARKTGNWRDVATQSLCRSAAGGDRCIMHQYTHRAIFATKSARPKTDPPPHFDANRFFDSKTVATAVGPAYIRTHHEEKARGDLVDADVEW